MVNKFLLLKEIMIVEIMLSYWF